MFKRYKFFFLSFILITYALLYMATTVPGSYNCDTDCEMMIAVDTILRKNRDYVYYANRCNQPVASDSICVLVKDTTGIDWNLLADTVCQIATSKGLLRQKVFILKTTSTGFPDTVARKQCP
jgi:hypothetical protein